MKKNKILIFIVIVTAIVAVIRTVSAQNQVKQLKREEYGGGDREYSLVMEKDGITQTRSLLFGDHQHRRQGRPARLRVDLRFARDRKSVV